MSLNIAKVDKKRVVIVGGGFGGLTIHLIQVFEPDTVFLGNAMHGITVPHHIYSMRFGGFLLFGFQIDDVSFH